MNILIEPIYIGIVQTIISLILISGLIFFGRIVNTKIFKSYNYLIFNLAISIIFFSQSIKIISYLGFFKQINFFFSFLIFFAGIYNLKYFYKIKNIKFFFNQINIYEILVISTLLVFLIISISPPSMADALDYHYGLPLYLLNLYEVPSPYLWMHGTLAGNGEFMNSLAIFFGSDNFGSLVQVITLIALLIYLREKTQNKEKLIFLCIFILSSPTLLQLVSGPKFLLFPQILTSLSLLLILEKKKIKFLDFLFISILLMGASQFKLSFLLSGIIIGSFLFIKSFFDNKLKILISCIFLILIFFGPTFVWNYHQLIDFNFRNIFSSMPIEAINTLQKYRENYNYIYPFNLLIPNSIGSISSILGFQFLILFFIFQKKIELQIIILVSFFTICLHYFLGMNEARIYYEFILWLAIGIYFLDEKNIKFSFFSKILSVQLLLVFIAALYFSIIALPGIFSNEYRTKFMINNSLHYKGIKWVNEVLPIDAKVLSELRSVAFYKNEFVPMDMFSYASKTELKEYFKLIKKKKVNFIVLHENSKYKEILKNCIGDKYLSSPELMLATRNPVNRNKKYKYSISIYKLDYMNIENCVK